MTYGIVGLIVWLVIGTKGLGLIDWAIALVRTTNTEVSQRDKQQDELETLWQQTTKH